jgi:hypothetical protein
MCTATEVEVGVMWHHLMPALFQGSHGEEWLTPAVSKMPLKAFEEEEASGTAIDSLDVIFTPTVVLEQVSRRPTDIQATFTPTVVLEETSGAPTDTQDALTPTVAPEQMFTAVSPS